MSRMKPDNKKRKESLLVSDLCRACLDEVWSNRPISNKTHTFEPIRCRLGYLNNQTYE